MATKPIMIRTIVLLVLLALFMTAFGHDGTLQEIPDDKVYTELQKTLINGSWGILTCRFTGPPFAVYWKKGHDPFTAPTLMTWTPDGKTGPRYEDGTCDMDENYSLVIKIVNYIDAGRYICLVSNQHGVLIDNYTDVRVSDIALETEPTLSAQMGQTGVLPCQVNIRPKKISWMRTPDIILVTMNLIRNVIERGGPGYEEGLFNITKEYSLVIKDVMIKHEGRYICEVIDFDTDNLYRDVSMFTLFAKPTDPFPTIEGCPMTDHSTCIITTDSSVILTCNVYQYYPDINLVFMHGSERVEPLINITWNNTDGTKNKSVTISAEISRDAYQCVASGIPGFDLNYERPSSVRLVQEQSNSPILAVLIVPIVLCLTVVLLAWLRLRKRRTQFLTQPPSMLSVHRNTQNEESDGTVDNSKSLLTEGIHMEGNGLSKEERYMEGNGLSKVEKYMEDHISYVELWKLVEFIIENHETLKLDKDLIGLLLGHDGDERSEKDTDQEYYYQQLGKWKDTRDETISQRTTLYDMCYECGLEQCVRKVEGFVEDISTKVPPSDLEHILWQIGEPHKITEFLASIGLDTEKGMELLSKKEIVRVAVGKLSTWKQSTLHFNPVVILTSIMEMSGYCGASDNFFQIPAEKKDVLIDVELERFVRDLTAVTTNHWDKLKSIIESSKRSIKPNDLNDNNTVLFDIKKMLLDWWEYVECSNNDKRRILESISRGKFEVTETPANNHWPSDDELKLIAGHLNSKSTASVFTKLGITSLPEDSDDEQHRFEVLRQWRTSINAKEWTSVYGQLRSALEAVSVSGTIGLIAHLVESTREDNSRLALYHRLEEAGFSLATAKNILVNHVAQGKLFTISNAMKEGDCKHGVSDISNDEEKAPGESEHLLKGYDVASADLKICIDEA